LFVYSGHGGMRDNTPIVVTSDNDLVTYSDLYEKLSDEKIISVIIHDACLVALPSPKTTSTSTTSSLSVNKKISPRYILVSSTCNNGVSFPEYLLPAVISNFVPNINLIKLGFKICLEVEKKYKENHSILKTTVEQFNAENNQQFPSKGWKPMMQISFFEGAEETL